MVLCEEKWITDVCIKDMMVQKSTFIYSVDTIAGIKPGKQI